MDPARQARKVPCGRRAFRSARWSSNASTARSNTISTSRRLSRLVPKVSLAETWARGLKRAGNRGIPPAQRAIRSNSLAQRADRSILIPHIALTDFDAVIAAQCHALTELAHDEANGRPVGP